MASPVLVAPVPAEVLASTLACPRLLQEVAFGTRQRSIDLPAGTRAFLYVSPDGSPFRSLLRPGFVTWTGWLGNVVPAVAQGTRRGMHPDPAVRPAFAESYDYRDAALFWHLRGLAPLPAPIPFDQFRDVDGAKLFGGFAPQWLSRGVLRDNADLRDSVRQLHAA